MAEQRREIPVFVPPLAAILLRAEELKQSPLTQEEVLRIRDEARTTMMRSEIVAQLQISRGYRDIDPSNCWNDWLTLRNERGVR